MVSEWVINGNINEFIKAHREANRFELVGFYSYRGPHLSLMKLFLIAKRRRSGIVIFTWAGGNPRELEGGMTLRTSWYPPPNMLLSRQTF